MRNSSKILLAASAFAAAATVTATPARAQMSEFVPVTTCEPGSSTMKLFINLKNGNHLTRLKFTGEGMVITIRNANGQERTTPLEEFDNSRLQRALEAYSEKTAHFRTAYCSAELPKTIILPYATVLKLTNE